jgi:hypothetical protein
VSVYKTVSFTLTVEAFNMQSLVELAMVIVFWLINHTVRCVRVCSHVMYALAMSGSLRLRMIASWEGSPRPGKPDTGELCIAKFMARTGVAYEYLTRGGLHTESGHSITSHADNGCTHVLFATLSTTMSHTGESSDVDVTKLCYHIPASVSFTPCDLSLLLHGMASWNRMARSTLKVTTISCTYRFDDDEVVDGAVLEPSAEA